jgi:hypothetical protein
MASFSPQEDNMSHMGSVDARVKRLVSAGPLVTAVARETTGLAGGKGCAAFARITARIDDSGRL